MFTDEEFQATLADVRQKLIPRLDNEIWNWRSNYRSGDDPESHFDDLVSALKDFKEEFADDAEAMHLIDGGVREIERVIEELGADLPEEPDRDDFRGSSGGSEDGDDGRSVFDDVDQ